MKSDKNINDVDEKIINAYLEQLDVETPDLWEQIKAGITTYDHNAMKPDKPQRKIKPMYIISVLAAAIAVFVIAAPILIMSTGKLGNNKSSDAGISEFAIKNEACQDEAAGAVMDEAAENDKAADGVENNDMENLADAEPQEEMTECEEEYIQSDVTISVKDVNETGYICEVLEADGDGQIQAGEVITVIFSDAPVDVGKGDKLCVDILSYDEACQMWMAKIK